MFLQYVRARVQRRTRRADIVDQQHPFSENIRSTEPGTIRRERDCHVRLPMVCSKFNLRPRRAVPDEGARNRWAQVTRDLTRLIEPTLMLPTPMQRNGYDAVDVLEHISASNPHLSGEGFCK